jgi:hypothetical protein
MGGPLTGTTTNPIEHKEMKSGWHTHHCPKCEKDKICYQMTHCTRPDEIICMDCELKEVMKKGEK